MKDITELLEPDLPTWYCKSCGYIFKNNEIFNHTLTTKGEVPFKISLEDIKRFEYEGVFEIELDECTCMQCESENTIRINSLERMDDIKVVANAIRHFFPYSRRSGQASEYIDYLGKLIRSARHFIHFSTLNIDDHIFDMILERSSEISIKGIIGANGRNFAASRLYDDIKPVRISQSNGANKYYYSVGEFINRSTYNSENVSVVYDMGSLYSHAKYIIIDGIACITGSANLSVSHWESESSDSFREYIEGSGNIEKVISINNEYFVHKFAKPDDE